MKHIKLFRTLSIALILSLLVIAIPASPVMAASLSILPVSGPPGTSTTITGSGYAGLTYNIVRTPSVNETGTPGVVNGSVSAGGFTAGYTIPSLPRGTYTLSDAGEGVTATFSVDSSLYLTTTTAKVGDQVNVGGRGFRNNVTVSVYFDSNIIKQPVSDDYGSFSSAFYVPEAPQGNHDMYGQDASGSTPLHVTFIVNPNITVTPTTTAAGSQVSVSGTGFTAFSPVTLTLGGVSIGTTVTASNLGSFSDALITIPGVASGSHALTATDNNAKSASTSITTSQSMTINPTTGTGGTTINISGNGFIASRSISILFNGATVSTEPGAVTSNASGNFSASIKAPALSAGTYTLNVSDGTNTSSATFTISTSAKIGQTTGAIGSDIPFSGSGFNKNSIIKIQYDGIEITSTTADNNGTFSATFKVPPGAAGPHSVIITDGINAIPATFTATASAQISGGGTSGSQITGYVGSDITVSGSGFKPGAVVAIKYDGAQASTATVANNGSFSATFKAPASKGGNHTVLASDGTNNMTFTFIMDSTPPPIPTLAPLPKDDSLPALANFQWSPVTDPSGVTYMLQVSQDPGFNAVILQKSLASDSTSYQLTAQEELKSTGKDKPYYWRVRAVDGASNEGPWSATQSFTVGYIMPSWIMYFIYAVAAIVLFGAGFFVGRRSRDREIE
jgi:hypothetical protein